MGSDAQEKAARERDLIERDLDVMTRGSFCERVLKWLAVVLVVIAALGIVVPPMLHPPAGTEVRFPPRGAAVAPHARSCHRCGGRARRV